MSTVDLATFKVTQRTFMRDESGRFISAVHAGAARSAQELARDTANLAKVFAPRGAGRTHTPQTQRLHSTIRHEMVTATQGVAYAGSPLAPHAAAHEKGAVPHLIPNAFGSGRPVLHPGNRAQHYMQRAGQAVSALSAAVVRRNMPGG